MNGSSSNKNASDNMAVRTSGLPLFTYVRDGETVEVRDIRQFRRESGYSEAVVEKILADLMIEGKSIQDEVIFELTDGQGLAKAL